MSRRPLHPARRYTGKYFDVIMGKLGWLALTWVAAKASGTTKKRKGIRSGS